MPYPTTAELVAASTVDVLTDLTPDQQDGLRQQAIIGVEAHTGQNFESVEGTEVLAGNESDTLYLPRRLARVDSVEVDGGLLSVDDFVLSPRADRLQLTGAPGNYYTRTLLSISGENRRGGFGATTITGLWGWESVPDAIALALRYDMEDAALADAHGLSDTIRSYRKLGLRNISQGNLSATLDEEPPPLSGRVRRLLDAEYVWLGNPGRLV